MIYPGKVWHNLQLFLSDLSSKCLPIPDRSRSGPDQSGPVRSGLGPGPDPVPGFRAQDWDPDRKPIMHVWKRGH
jgi:hypothetical protein